jgi:hypothetical protein
MYNVSSEPRVLEEIILVNLFYHKTDFISVTHAAVHGRDN